MKKAVIFRWSALFLSVLFVVSCSKSPESVDDGASSKESKVTSKGLGELSQFEGQAKKGESYTTKAPHNQVYLFAFDDSNLAKKYLPSLKAQSEYLKSHSGARVLLAGHTDERGSREYNIALGERRANAVAQIMKMSGVNGRQIRVVSYGKERPVSFGHDEASYRQNRRVEFIYEATR